MSPKSFLVEKKRGGLRPVINLKGLNNFVKMEHFKVEGLHPIPMAGELTSLYVSPSD